MTNPGADFDEFAAAAWPRLRRSAYLLTGDYHLAEDLAQTALARTFAQWRRVRRQDAMAYSRKVLVNLNIDRLRRRRMVEIGGDSAEHALSRVTDGEDAEGTVTDRDRVVRLLSVLTDRERRVVVLRHYFDLGEAATASELGISPGTVKSTLSRALAKLRVSEQSLEEAVGQ